MTEARSVWNDWAAHRERRRPVMRVVGAPVDRWLIEAVAVQPGETVLDLAAGPGDLGFDILEEVGPGVRLITSDLAPAVLDLARRVATARGLSDVDVRVLDGQALDLPDASIDAIVSRWGYMLMPRPDAAFSEAARVLRPGGRLALSVWAAPARNPWTTIDAQVCAGLGWVPPSDPEAPGGMFSLADPDRLRSFVESAGFTLRRLEPVAVQWSYRDTADYLSVEVATAGPRADWFRALPSDRLEAARLDAERLLEPWRSTEGYLVPGETLNLLAVASPGRGRRGPG